MIHPERARLAAPGRHWDILCDGCNPRQKRHSSTGRRISAVSALLGIPVPTIRSWERRYGFPVPDRTRGKPSPLHDRGDRAAPRGARPDHPRGTCARGDRRGARARSRRPRCATATSTRSPRPPTRWIRTGCTTPCARPPMHLGVEPGDHRDRAARHARGGLALEGRAHGHLERARGEPGHAPLAGFDRRVRAAPASRVDRSCWPRAPGEQHTIGLEAFAVLLARRGWPTRLLGADTPVASLVAAVRGASAAGVVITAHRSVVRRGAIAALTATHRLRGVASFYGGNAFAAERTRLDVPGIYLGDDLLAAADLLEATCDR